ncbi:hypothetical protein AVEN_94718-1 [Araneus ventricosus]|uniref:Uncharacterized protein n=1 Tax=Araneus ventricosus TaxID=182803 RepID=A0A4Y2CM30_ARAVE|nr:hypothetical protein AVEN_94718-1 [Araneus ventricosus]
MLFLSALTLACSFMLASLSLGASFGGLDEWDVLNPSGAFLRSSIILDPASYRFMKHRFRYDTGSGLIPLNDDLNSNWQTCKKTILKRAKAFIPRDDQFTANGLAAKYQLISRLNLTNEDKHVLRKARNIVHGCRSTDLGDLTLAA